MSTKFEADIQEVLIDRDMVNKKVRDLAAQITDVYSSDSEDLIVVGLLKGSIVFMSD